MTDPSSLRPGYAQRLDAKVTRIVAPNGGPMTGAGTNTYLVGDRELMVIDPGPDHDAHLSAIATAAAGRIRWILCTHTHEDHAPGATRLSQMTGAPIAAMRAPQTDHDFELRPDRLLTDGESIECEDVQVRAIHTPGHASNHVCFLLPETGMLFTGDHIMQGSTVVIWPPDGNMRAYLGSLRRLQLLDLKSLAPGHGYVIDTPGAEIQKLIQHRLKREAKVRQALRSSGTGATVQMLLPLAYDDVPASLQRMAAFSLQAHLDKLVEDGEIICDESFYFPA